MLDIFKNFMIAIHNISIGHAKLALLSGHSRFVGMMKIVLPAIALSLIFLIVAWPHLAPRNKLFRLAFTKGDIKSAEISTMLNPRYYGTDDKNHPFTITARSSSQPDAREDMIALEKPSANVASNTGNIVIRSDIGFYRQKNGLLDLVGHVEILQDNGYQLHTNSARIEISPGNAWGEEETIGYGPAGKVEGEGFRLWEHGSHIIFTGNAKANLTPIHTKSSIPKS